jgi:DNA-binding MarR family transcriptional regulator
MSSDKRQLFEELVAEVRRSQAATLRFDRAVAEAVGLNLTDMSCLDVLSQTGPLTAGQLAARTGLSSGAMTTAIDRLELAGYARRVRDDQDRRRVMVELTHAAAALDGFYTEHDRLGEREFREHTTEQLQILLRFVRIGRELNERRAAEVEQETRTRAAS